MTDQVFQPLSYLAEVIAKRHGYEFVLKMINKHGTVLFRHLNSFLLSFHGISFFQTGDIRKTIGDRNNPMHYWYSEYFATKFAEYFYKNVQPRIVESKAKEKIMNVYPEKSSLTFVPPPTALAMFEDKTLASLKALVQYPSRTISVPMVQTKDGLRFCLTSLITAQLISGEFYNYEWCQVERFLMESGVASEDMTYTVDTVLNLLKDGETTQFLADDNVLYHFVRIDCLTETLRALVQPSFTITAAQPVAVVVNFVETEDRVTLSQYLESYLFNLNDTQKTQLLLILQTKFEECAIRFEVSLEVINQQIALPAWVLKGVDLLDSSIPVAELAAMLLQEPYDIMSHAQRVNPALITFGKAGTDSVLEKLLYKPTIGSLTRYFASF